MLHMKGFGMQENISIICKHRVVIVFSFILQTVFFAKHNINQTYELIQEEKKGERG